MHSPFDILKKKPEGSFCWFEAASDLASANIRITELLALSRVSTLCLTNARITSFWPPIKLLGRPQEGVTTTTRKRR